MDQSVRGRRIRALPGPRLGAAYASGCCHVDDMLDAGVTW